MKYTVFSARAECGADAHRFWRFLGNLTDAYSFTVEKLPNVPVAVGDVTIEVRFHEPQEYQAVIDEARKVPDGHVLVQTLRPVPLAQNSLNRNYARS